MLYPKNAERIVYPAQPGWHVIWPWKDPDGSNRFSRDPVIAWMTIHVAEEYRQPVRDEKCVTAHTYPITADDVEEMEHCALMDPNGKFIIPHDSSHIKEEDFFKAWWKLHPQENAA